VAVDRDIHFRVALIAATGPIGMFTSGMQLIRTSVVWKQAAGGAAMATWLLLVALITRWLLKPVDPESLELLRSTRDSGRLISRRRWHALVHREDQRRHP